MKKKITLIISAIMILVLLFSMSACYTAVHDKGNELYDNLLALSNGKTYMFSYFYMDGVGIPGYENEKLPFYGFSGEIDGDRMMLNLSDSLLMYAETDAETGKPAVYKSVGYKKCVPSDKTLAVLIQEGSSFVSASFLLLITNPDNYRFDSVKTVEVNDKGQTVKQTLSVLEEELIPDTMEITSAKLYETFVDGNRTGTIIQCAFVAHNQNFSITMVFVKSDSIHIVRPNIVEE